MSGPEEGPRLFKTTASNIISRMWWRHASHNSSRFSFCSSKVQAPLSRPVLLEVVSKLIPLAFDRRSHCRWMNSTNSSLPGSAICTAIWTTISSPLAATNSSIRIRNCSIRTTQLPTAGDRATENSTSTISPRKAGRSGEMV
ncbi:unnamed protein product [Nesidiocoris tenuis]|uniref:Uncharacterized protein n=1 Tax=Nesidiocoris tenuis TaxID=355587 RepID=A0A6H5GQX8_9HEMI|nr:unnamed protein product [Nesidiocoris tenuis]